MRVRTGFILKCAAAVFLVQAAVCGTVSANENAPAPKVPVSGRVVVYVTGVTDLLTNKKLTQSILQELVKTGHYKPIDNHETFSAVIDIVNAELAHRLKPSEEQAQQTAEVQKSDDAEQTEEINQTKEAEQTGKNQEAESIAELPEQGNETEADGEIKPAAQEPAVQISKPEIISIKNFIKIAKEKNADYLFLGITTMPDSADIYMINANIIDVNTSETVAKGVAASRFSSPNFIRNISVNLVSELVSHLSEPHAVQTAPSSQVSQTNADSPSRSEPRRKKDDIFSYRYFQRNTKIGFRLAHNSSNSNVDIYYNNANGYTSAKSDFGSGMELGFVLNTKLSPRWSMITGCNLIFRAPVNLSVHDNLGYRDISFYLYETSTAFPLLFRYRLTGLRNSIFINAGFQGENVDPDIKDRNLYDLGVVAGGGFRFGHYVELDGRLIWSVVDFVDIKKQRGNRLFQYSIGLTIRDN